MLDRGELRSFFRLEHLEAEDFLSAKDVIAVAQTDDFPLADADIDAVYRVEREQHDGAGAPLEARVAPGEEGVVGELELALAAADVDEVVDELVDRSVAAVGQDGDEPRVGDRGSRGGLLVFIQWHWHWHWHWHRPRRLGGDSTTLEAGPAGAGLASDRFFTSGTTSSSAARVSATAISPAATTPTFIPQCWQKANADGVLRPHDMQIRCCGDGCDGALAVDAFPTTAASGDGSAAFAIPGALDDGPARSVEPHILQKFMPIGFGVLHAGQATDEGDSPGATGAAGDEDADGMATTGRGVGFFAMTVWLPGGAACPESRGAGAMGLGVASGCGGSTDGGAATGFTAEAGETSGLTPILAGSGAGAAMVFCGPADGLDSGNRPASGLGPISGMRQPQFWQNAAPSRTGRPHFGQGVEGEADIPDISPIVDDSGKENGQCAASSAIQRRSRDVT